VLTYVNPSSHLGEKVPSLSKCDRCCYFTFHTVEQHFSSVELMQISPLKYDYQNIIDVVNQERRK
jgi:hypothetical protein